MPTFNISNRFIPPDPSRCHNQDWCCCGQDHIKIGVNVALTMLGFCFNLVQIWIRISCNLVIILVGTQTLVWMDKPTKDYFMVCH